MLAWFNFSSLVLFCISLSFLNLLATLNGRLLLDCLFCVSPQSCYLKQNICLLPSSSISFTTTDGLVYTSLGQLCQQLRGFWSQITTMGIVHFVQCNLQQVASCMFFNSVNASSYNIYATCHAIDLSILNPQLGQKNCHNINSSLITPLPNCWHGVYFMPITSSQIKENTLLCLCPCLICL